MSTEVQMDFDTIDAAMRAVTIYSWRDGHLTGLTDDPEKVVALRNAVAEFNVPEEGLRYTIAAETFSFAPGGKPHYELRGFPRFLTDLGRKIAHEQSLEKGYSGIRNYRGEVAA